MDFQVGDFLYFHTLLALWINLYAVYWYTEMEREQ
jgi:hypothetical protein